MNSWLFTKRKHNTNKQHNLIVRKNETGIKCIIMPCETKLKISESQADRIFEIVCEELDKPTSQTSYLIAMRTCEEVLKLDACSAYADGGDDGKIWLIKVSRSPREFND